MGGITNLLSNMANIATKGENISKEIAEVRSRHISVIKELLPPKKQPTPLTKIQLLLTELEDILQGIKLIRECSDRTRDLVLSFGERLISMMCAQLLKHQGSSAQFIDSRKLILTNSQHGNASVNFQETYKKINNIINPDLTNEQKINEVSKKLQMLGFSSVIVDNDGYMPGKANA